MRPWPLALLLGLAVAGAPVSGQPALYVSWGDQILARREADRLDTPARIAASLPEWMGLAGAPTVYWRISSWRIRQDHEVRRTTLSRYWEAVDQAFAAGDPLRAAADTVHAAGGTIYAYETLFDEGSPASVLYGDTAPFPWQSRFTIEHPEFLVTDRAGTGHQWGVLEYAWPEVRRFMIARFVKFLDDYPYDGIYLCTRTHSPPASRADEYGYGAPIVAEFQRRYGVDLRTEAFDPRAWEALRGEYLTEFLRELSAVLHARGKRLAIGIPFGDVLGPPYGHLALDWPTWVRDRLIDELVVGVQTGNWHYPSLRGHDRSRGYRLSADEGWGLPDEATELAERYGPACRAAGVVLRRWWGHSAVPPAVPADGPLDGYLIDATTLAYGGGTLALPTPPGTDLADGRFTLSLWVKPAERADAARLISRYDHTLPDDAGRGWEVYLPDDGTVVVRWNDGQTDEHLTTRQTLPVGEWSHLVVVSEGAGGEVRVFVNGQADPATRPAPARLRAVPCELLLGQYAGGTRRFRGAVRDLRLYTTPRTPADLPATAADLLLNYRLDALDGGPVPGLPPARPLRLRSVAATIEPGALWLGPLP